MKHIFTLFSLCSLLFMAPVIANSTVGANGIADTAELVRPVLPGMNVPNTCLQDLNKNKVCSNQLFEQKPTILVVYRGGWCPYCNGQLNRLKKIETQLKELGYQILAVSPDSNKNISKQRAKQNQNYQLLTDNELALSKSLGLAFFLDKKTEEKYRNRLGVPFIDINGDSRVSLPVPAVYLIDKQGMVHFQYVNPNYKVRLDEEVLLLAAKKALEAMD